MRRLLIVSHSHWETDPRVRRQIETLVGAGWSIEGLFLDAPVKRKGLRTWRFPLERRRGGTLRYLIEYGGFLVWSFFWITARFLVFNPAVVYVNSPPEVLVFASFVARLRGAAVVLDVHDPMPELLLAKGRKSGLIWRMLVAQERWALRFADKVITVHEPLRELLMTRTSGVDIDVVMNVPDTTGWEPIARRRNSRTVVFTGTVAVRYGLDDMLTAVALVEDRIPGLVLEVIGDGEDRESLQARAVSLGISDRCEFVPKQPWPEVRRRLENAWVGVNVPKPDALGELSFSNKVVEWISLRLPVIAGRTPTLQRFFSEESLWYVTPGSAEEIAEALIRLHEAADEVVVRQLDAASDDLRRIAWPVQRQRLLEVVEQAKGAGG
jgi:glycosyltransferase involved in cell wall biosynthesis